MKLHITTTIHHPRPLNLATCMFNFNLCGFKGTLKSSYMYIIQQLAN